MPSHSPYQRKPLRGTHDGLIHWLNTNKENCGPFRDDDMFDTLRFKSLSELSLLCGLHARRFGAITNPVLTQCLSFVEEWAHDPYLLEFVRRMPQLLIFSSTIYIGLRWCGIGDTSLHESLQEAVDLGYATAMERRPTGRMGLSYTLTKSKIRHPLPTVWQLYPETLLAQCPPPYFISRDDAFAVTHVVFYATDFGFRTRRPPVPLRHASVQELIQAIMFLYARRSDWAVVSELLLAAHQLQFGASPICTRLWESLRQAQNPDGSLSPPGETGDTFLARYNATSAAAIAVCLVI